MGNDSTQRAAQELEAAIAGRIRELRLSRGWTLEQLGDVTGLSKSYLSQVENSEKKPPIGTLAKIAFGLGIDTITLITGESPEEESPSLTLVRPTERRMMKMPGAGDGMVYESVGYKKPDRELDAYIVTAAFDFPPERLVHTGQELIYVLEGRLEFLYDGGSVFGEAGDVLLFDSDRPHHGRSVGDRPTKFLVVYSNRRRK